MGLKKKPIHKAWYMLAGCCLLQGGSMGLVNNCRGIFFALVTEATGFPMGAFTAYLLFQGLFACVFTPLAPRIMEKVNVRRLLGSMSLLFSASEAAMGFARSLPAFYVFGSLQGVSGAFLMFFTAPMILGQWFKKRSGLAIGLCSAFSGVIGVLFNPIGSAVIDRFGWQMGYVFFGVLVFLMTFPVSAFLLRLRPGDAGLLPYGEEEALSPDTPPGGIPVERVRRSPGFVLVLIAVFCVSLGGSFGSHLSPWGVSLGYGTRVAAFLISASMAGNVVSKFILGSLYDRRGLAAALSVALAVPAVGCAMFFIGSVPVRMLASLLFGFVMGAGNVMPSLVVKDVYGLRSYSGMLSYTMTSLTFSNAVSVSLGGMMVDLFGAPRGYMLSFLAIIVILAVAAILYTCVIRGGRKLVREYMAEIKETAS